MIPTDAAGRIAYLPRGPGPIRLAGVLAADRIGLEAWLEAQPGRLLASDLSIGGWRPFQLLTELAGQLGVSLPADVSAGLAVPTGNDLDAETVGSWVDAEARGDPTIAIAERWVRVLVPALRAAAATLLVVVPADGASWRAGDLWALRFLATVAEPTGCRLVLLFGGQGPPALPAGIEVAWETLPVPGLPPGAASLLDPSPLEAATWLGRIPGVISPPLAQALGVDPDMARQLVAMPSGVGLVPPELRAAGSETDGSTLAARTAAVPWLAAACQDTDPDVGVLLNQAWHAFGTAAVDLAGDLAGRALVAARDTDASVAALLTVQTMRLVSQDYAGLAMAEPTPDAAEEVDRRRLDRFRAWGRVLCGDGVGALALFGERPAEAPLDPQPWLDLYLRNIHALALARAGEADAALAVELDIADRLAAIEPSSWHLAYLNALNLSRLYRMRGDLDRAIHWLNRAEESTLGVASPSDLVHFHVLRARLAADAGDQSAGCRHWQAAALIVAALPVPDTLGWRVATAILSRPVRQIEPEAIAAALLDRLGADSAAPGRRPSPTILLADYAPAIDGPVAIGAPGWGVVAVRPTLPVPVDGAACDALRATLAERLGAEAMAAGTLLVDLRHGAGLPDGMAALLGCCLWHGADRLVWNGQAMALDPLLATAEQRLEISPGVAAIDGRVVRFKRYRPRLTLTATAEALTARSGAAVAELSPVEQETAAGLVAAGVMVVATILADPAPVLAEASHG